MRTEIVINLANEAIYQLEYYKKLYLTHKKINIFDTFYYNNYLFDSISRLLLFKILINLLIELFL